jgi:hypothetical protein
MTAPASVVLDNEAVQALAAVTHPKHRRVLAFIEAVNQRNQRRRSVTGILVPVAVRVEAGWDRTAHGSSLVNRLARARDVVLDGHAADRASQLRAAAGVSVVDATVAQAAESAPSATVILTSDVADMVHLAAMLGRGVRVVRI